MIAEPGQFELEGMAVIFQINDDERSVGCIDPPCFFETECFVVEPDTFFQIGDIEIQVYHCKLHDR